MQQHPTVSEMNWPQRIAVVLIDLLMLAELCLAMKLSADVPETFTSTFFKTFFPMLLPTLAAGFIAIRWMRSRSESNPT